MRQPLATTFAQKLMSKKKMSSEKNEKSHRGSLETAERSHAVAKTYFPQWAVVDIAA